METKIYSQPTDGLNEVSLADVWEAFDEEVGKVRGFRVCLNNPAALRLTSRASLLKIPNTI